MSAENKVTDIRLYRGSNSEENVSPANTGGPGGGGGVDNIEKRVTTLEEDVKVIRGDLTTLTVRSENFSTKADVSDIRAEIAALSGSLRTEFAAHGGAIRTEIADKNGALKAAILESQQAILKEIDIKFEKLADKTRWKWSAVFIPLGVGVAGVLATLLASYLTS